MLFQVAFLEEDFQRENAVCGAAVRYEAVFLLHSFVFQQSHESAGNDGAHDLGCRVKKHNSSPDAKVLFHALVLEQHFEASLKPVRATAPFLPEFVHHAEPQSE